jgi:hypothetical protein
MDGEYPVRRLWASVAAVAAYLFKRLEVLEGVASMAVFVNTTDLMQYLQAL